MGRISSKGQITVPLDVRERLGLVAGTEVEFVVRDAEVVLRKGGEGADPVDRVYGILDLGRPVDRILEDLRGPAPAPFRARPARRPYRASIAAAGPSRRPRGRIARSGFQAARREAISSAPPNRWRHERIYVGPE